MENKLMAESRRRILLRIKVMNWMMKEGLPISKFDSVLRLLKELDTPNVYCESSKNDQTTSCDHDSRWSALEMLKALSTVAEEDL